MKENYNNVKIKISKKNNFDIKKDDKEYFKKILKIFLITRIILVIFLVLSEVVLSNTDISKYKHVFELFDNEHYLNIAKYGYEKEFQYAFFPLTPLMIRYLGKFGFLLINQVCVFLSGYLLYLIVSKFYDKEKSYYPALFYFISPIAIFTVMFYSEGLFIFFTLLAYYLYKNRKNYLALGITLGLSVLTRSLGSMLFFAIFIFMFIDFVRKKEKFKNILITYIPATIISCLYPIFLYLRTGDLLYFSSVQYDYWARISTNIFRIIFDVAKVTFVGDFSIHVIDFFIVFGLMCYIFWYIFKHRKNKECYDIFVYMIFSLIAICSTIRTRNDAIASFYRYIFGCFPIYFMFKKNYLSFIFMILLSVFITYLFLVGFYFF